MKREKWVIKTLRGRSRSQVVASYQGFVSIIESRNSSNIPETNFLNKLLDEKKKIDNSNSVSKKKYIFTISNMWEISQRFWIKYVDNNDSGFEEYYTIHWINHNFLVILHPEAFDFDEQSELGIVNERMFDYDSLSIVKNPPNNAHQKKIKQKNLER